MKHSNINTVRCHICGEPIAPGEGIHDRGGGFAHPGCAAEEGRKAARDDAGDFDLGVHYTYNED